jgi:hypothetical protein
MNTGRAEEEIKSESRDRVQSAHSATNILLDVMLVEHPNLTRSRTARQLIISDSKEIERNLNSLDPRVNAAYEQLRQGSMLLPEGETWQVSKVRVRETIAAQVRRFDEREFKGRANFVLHFSEALPVIVEKIDSLEVATSWMKDSIERLTPLSKERSSLLNEVQLAQQNREAQFTRVEECARERDDAKGVKDVAKTQKRLEESRATLVKREQTLLKHQEKLSEFDKLHFDEVQSLQRELRREMSKASECLQKIQALLEPKQLSIDEISDGVARRYHSDIEAALKKTLFDRLADAHRPKTAFERLKANLHTVLATDQEGSVIGQEPFASEIEYFGSQQNREICLRGLQKKDPGILRLVAENFKTLDSREFVPWMLSLVDTLPTEDLDKACRMLGNECQTAFSQNISNDPQQKRYASFFAILFYAYANHQGLLQTLPAQIQEMCELSKRLSVS